MTAFPQLSDEDISHILAYTATEPIVVNKDDDGGSGDN